MYSMVFLTLHEGRAFNKVRNKIEDIKEEGGTPAYHFSWNVLNAKDYGSPQNRRRAFMVGILKGTLRVPFCWPEERPPVSISKFLEPKTGRGM